MGYAGFPGDTAPFLADLAANNSRDWLAAHRDRYEASWRDAGLALLEALQPFCAAARPRLDAPPRLNGALRRLNRDTRFSADKSPYAPMLHLVLAPVGAPDRNLGFHLVLHPDHLAYGAGWYGLPPAALEAFRARVVNPADRARLLKAAAAAGAVGSVWDPPDLKRLPKGWDAEPDSEHLLRRKSVILRGRTPALPDWLSTPRCLSEVERLAEAHLPLLAWLMA